MCVSFFCFPDSRRSCHSCRIWNSIGYFPDFTVRYGIKKSMNMRIKQKLTALLFGEWYKIIVPSVKFNFYLLFTSAQRAPVNSRPRLNFKFPAIPLISSQYLYNIFIRTEYNDSCAESHMCPQQTWGQRSSWGY